MCWCSFANTDAIIHLLVVEIYNQLPPYFSHYLFYQWPVDSPHKGPVMWSFDVSFEVSLNIEQAVKFPVIWGFMILMWSHCNIFVQQRRKMLRLCLKSKCSNFPDFHMAPVPTNPHTWSVLCEKQVSSAGTCNYIPQYLWDIITFPCPWYLLLAQHSSYDSLCAEYISIYLYIPHISGIKCHTLQKVQYWDMK